MAKSNFNVFHEVCQEQGGSVWLGISIVCGQEFT